VRLGALGVLWGSGSLFIKEALGGLSPFQIVFGRLLAAAVAMLALTLAAKRRLPTDPRIWVHLAVMAIITNIAPYFPPSPVSPPQTTSRALEACSSP
jgi:drug/metabolite transporter (DMT)-like permease